MKFEYDNKDVFRYASATLAFISAFWLIGLFELITAKSYEANLFLRLVNDFWSAFIIGIVLFPVYLILYSLTKKYALLIIKVFYLLFVIIQFCLVKYSLTTLLNLGADLLGYSFEDISNTITASETFSITYFLPFIVFPILFFASNLAIEKYVSRKFLTGGGVLLIILFGSIKLVADKASETANTNKITYLINDIIKFQREKNSLSAYALNRSDYPLLQSFKTSKDVLAPFINLSEQKPNIVVLIVEGLGAEFVGNNTYAGFTPYLDQLISKSLYWDNFVSNTGRTFGVLPSLLGSLPLGETGFLEISETPTHISLISALKNNGYTTSFYTGDQSSFDKKVNFLEYNEIDYIIDENQFGPEYKKTEANSGGFSWGYPDSEIYKKTLASIEDKKTA